MLPVVLSGALITEYVFAWPGIGRLFYEAAVAPRLSDPARHSDDDLGGDDRRHAAGRRGLRYRRSARTLHLGFRRGPELAGRTVARRQPSKFPVSAPRPRRAADSGPRRGDASGATASACWRMAALLLIVAVQSRPRR